MPSTYELRFLDAFGMPLGVIDGPFRLSYVRTVNAVGQLTMVVRRDAIPDSAVYRDARIEVWRQPEGGTLAREGDGPWLVQLNGRGESERDGRFRRIQAASLMTLLDRRVTAAVVGSAGASKYAAGDDMMKAFVREALGASAGTATWNGITVSRDWSSTIAVAANLGASGATSKDASYRNLMTVCQEIARDAIQDHVTGGTTPALYFDIVQTGTNSFEFRTYAGQRGIDRSTGTGQLVVSIERGSLGGTVEVVDDWSDAVTLVWAGGGTQATGPQYGVWGDRDSINASPWGLSEAFVSAPNVSRPAGATAGGPEDRLAGEARTELRRLRSDHTLSGDLVSAPGAVYGVHWGFGDLVAAEYESTTFPSMVEAVTVSCDSGGRETVKAALRSRSTLVR